MFIILVKDTVGPLARDMDGLIEVTRSILMQKMYILDPYIPPVPFRDEVSLHIFLLLIICWFFFFN